MYDEKHAESSTTKRLALFLSLTLSSYISTSIRTCIEKDDDDDHHRHIEQIRETRQVLLLYADLHFKIKHFD